MKSKLWVEQSVTKKAKIIAPMDSKSIVIVLCLCYLLTLINWRDVFEFIPFNQLLWKWRHYMYDFEWNEGREYHQQALYFMLIFYIPLRIYTVAIFVAAFREGRDYSDVVSGKHFNIKTSVKFFVALCLMCPILYMLHLIHVPTGIYISEGSFLYRWFGTFLLMAVGGTWLICACCYHVIFYFTSMFYRSAGRQK